jgi:hypothetical protein
LDTILVKSKYTQQSRIVRHLISASASIIMLARNAINYNEENHEEGDASRLGSLVEQTNENEDWFTDEDGDMFMSPLLLQEEEQQQEGSLSSLGGLLPNQEKAAANTNGRNRGGIGDDSFDAGDLLATGPLNDVEDTPPPAAQQRHEEAERPKSIRFADVIATPFVTTRSGGSTVISMASDDMSDDMSIHSDDHNPFFMGEGRHMMSYQNGFDEESSEGSIDMGMDDGESMANDEKDEDDESIDPEKEEEAKIKRQMMWMAGGMGAMALVGWGVGKVKQLFEKGGGEEDDIAATAQQQVTGDVASQSVQDVATSAITTDPSAALSASTANASQSQSFFAAGVLPGDGGMTAAQ